MLGGVPMAWPFAVLAQAPAMPAIGFLSGRSPGEAAHLLGAFRQGLNETGYVEGKNVGIEFRWAEGDYNRLPALASDLVRRDALSWSRQAVPVRFWRPRRRLRRFQSSLRWAGTRSRPASLQA
jgi:hypothetical protein